AAYKVLASPRAHAAAARYASGATDGPEDAEQPVFLGGPHRILGDESGMNRARDSSSGPSAVFPSLVGTGAAVRIGITGSYGGLNLGDEAILHSIIRQLRASIDAQLLVFTRNLAATYRLHGVHRAVSRLDLILEEARAEVEQLDLLILGGGGILFDRDAESY